MKKSRNIILLIIVICFLGYSISKFRQLTIEAKRNPINQTDVVPKTYLELFNKQFQRNLTTNGTFNLKERTPISLLTYDEKYSLAVTEINIDNGFNLKRDIKEIYRNFSSGGNEVYVPFKRPGYDLNFKSSSLEVAFEIYLSLEGNGIDTVIKNDSTVLYNLNLKSFLIQYKPNDVIQIEARNSNFLSLDKPKVSLMFKMIKKHLYFFVISPLDQDENMDDKLLLALTGTNLKPSL